MHIQNFALVNFTTDNKRTGKAGDYKDFKGEWEEEKEATYLYKHTIL